MTTWYGFRVGGQLTASEADSEATTSARLRACGGTYSGASGCLRSACPLWIASTVGLEQGGAASVGQAQLAQVRIVRRIHEAVGSEEEHNDNQRRDGHDSAEHPGHQRRLGAGHRSGSNGGRQQQGS
eukprot:scaffold31448_cov101-Isochrysis_galbana.AAC.2